MSNLLLVVASAGLIVWSGQLIKTRVTSVISRDAVINGVLIDLKTPAPSDEEGDPNFPDGNPDFDDIFGSDFNFDDIWE